MNDKQFSRSVRFMCPMVGIVTVLVGGVSSSADEIPEALEQIVFGDEKRPIVRATVNGTIFEGLTKSSEFLYLMWPAESTQPAPFAYDPAAAKVWLDRGAAELGYAGFESRFKGVSNWRTNTVWTYELVRQGLPLFDARLEVHWDQATFLGLVIHTPGKIAAIEDGDVPADQEWVYYPVRADRQQYRLVAARVVRVQWPNRVEISIDLPDVRFKRVEQAMGNASQGATFEEWEMPVGIFPDQISVDDAGIVWISQPLDDQITEFDPIAEQFTHHPSPVGAEDPDGLIVGTLGRVWTGMYFSGSLGLYDANAETFVHYAAPYGGARMAIPVETTDGHVWVTDHELNRISEFDPASETFLQSLIMPTNNCWVVQGYEDIDHGFIYFTEFNVDQLGRIEVGGSSVTDIPTPGGGPAFCVYSDCKVYYSRWNEAGIGAYDVETGDVVEYEFGLPGENGGPMWLTPDGQIVTGTRNVGYIMVFDPVDETMTGYQIPTAFPGLKDGLTVAADGAIWFTESGPFVDKLGKLVLPSMACDGDVQEDGVVDATDLLLVLGAWGPCPGCPEDFDGDGNVGASDLLILLANWGPCP